MYSWVASVFQDGLTAFCPQFVPRKFAMKLSLSHVIISYVEYTKTIIPYLGPRGLYTNELAGSCQRLNTCITKIVKSKSIFFFFLFGRGWYVRAKLFASLILGLSIKFSTEAFNPFSPKGSQTIEVVTNTDCPLKQQKKNLEKIGRIK